MQKLEKSIPGKRYGCVDGEVLGHSECYILSRIADALYALNDLSAIQAKFWLSLDSETKISFNYMSWTYVSQ